MAGYVAAIKAGQEGMKVRICYSAVVGNLANDKLGDMRRETWHIRWNMFECGLHSL